MSDDGFPYPVDVPGNFSNAGMPLGDAQDPPVDLMALEAARDIWGAVPELLERSKAQAVSRIQLRVEEAINAALDRHEVLGGRRTR